MQNTVEHIERHFITERERHYCGARTQESTSHKNFVYLRGSNSMISLILSHPAGEHMLP
jgi:hypothetical protein